MIVTFLLYFLLTSRRMCSIIQLLLSYNISRNMYVEYIQFEKKKQFQVDHNQCWWSLFLWLVLFLLFSKTLTFTSSFPRMNVDVNQLTPPYYSSRLADFFPCFTFFFVSLFLSPTSHLSYRTSFIIFYSTISSCIRRNNSSCMRVVYVLNYPSFGIIKFHLFCFSIWSSKFFYIFTILAIILSTCSRMKNLHIQFLYKCHCASINFENKYILRI